VCCSGDLEADIRFGRTPSIESRGPVRIALIANLYPDATHPALGTFVLTRVEALRAAGVAVDVIAVPGWAAHHRVVAKYGHLAARAVARSILARLQRLHYDVVEGHIAYPTGVVALPVARLLGAKLALFAHGADVFQVAWRNPLHSRLARMVIGAADLVVANSRFTYDHILTRFEISPSKVVVASPGIDLGTFRERCSNRNAPRNGILYVGRLDPEKGAHVLLRALADCPPYIAQDTLTVVGSGREADRLRKEADQLGLNARFLGALRPTEVASEMRRALVTVVPSIYPEPLGLVAIEAMAAGSLVVASSAGGLRETVLEGETGFTSRPGDAGDLAAALVRAYHVAQDRPRYEALRARAFLMACEHDRARAVEITLEAYQRLIELGNGPGRP
jgi:glycosyltransferase involved in cell wall biosynthesis